MTGYNYEDFMKAAISDTMKFTQEKLKTERHTELYKILRRKAGRQGVWTVILAYVMDLITIHEALDLVFGDKHFLDKTGRDYMEIIND
jgi:hypothetical protein